MHVEDVGDEAQARRLHLDLVELLGPNDRSEPLCEGGGGRRGVLERGDARREARRAGGARSELTAVDIGDDELGGE